MNFPLESLTAHLLTRLGEVTKSLGTQDTPISRETRIGDLLDSMAMVEFLAVMAQDFGVTADAIEECTARRFGTVGELATSLNAAGLMPRQKTSASLQPSKQSPETAEECWLCASAVRLPQTVQAAAVINEALQRPNGWLESHAGIHQRRIWENEDPLAAVAHAGRECLQRSGLSPEDIGALLVTSEAPPLLVGLAAALHDRLHLKTQTPALEIGSASTGFLAAVWTAQALLPRVRKVMVLSVEAPSRYLPLKPGAAGEVAALFGDGAAAALFCAEPPGPEAVLVGKVLLWADGKGGQLMQIDYSKEGRLDLQMQGIALANRAVRAMAQSVLELAEQSGLRIADLAGVVAHGGNGRMPGLLALQLGLPPERVWSETPNAGNLGSASLPVAWALHQSKPIGPVVWTAVGAGLTWGAAMLPGDSAPPSVVGGMA